jgi:hypothetical protein
LVVATIRASLCELLLHGFNQQKPTGRQPSGSAGRSGYLESQGVSRQGENLFLLHSEHGGWFQRRAAR